MRALLVTLLLVSACATEASISAALEHANTCEVPEDCVNLGSVCPFGCNLVVNADEADKLRQRLNTYLDHAESCMQTCEQATAVDCVAFRCEAVYGN